jgi:hypothetical protein
MAGKDLECSFFSRDQGVVEAIRERSPELEESLKSLEFTPVLRAEKKDDLVPEQKSGEEKEEPSARDFFHRIDITI